MLFRFSLYGFLKNQQYYEPFIILAFREKGLAFTMIGFLIGFRELAINLMEVPSGVLADLCGRRRSMILSFIAYILSFTIFALSDATWHLFVAMLLFAIGEAFRTGTHKAMILDWLRLQGREGEKTKTYGYTRSWSKAGSALSVVIAAGLVFHTGQYSTIFWYSIIPYALGIVNFLGYPAELDGRPESAPSLKSMATHLWKGFRQSFVDRRLRRVLLESMGFESTYKVAQDYLQPILKQMAIALPFLSALPALADLDTRERTAIVVGVIYLALQLAGVFASRKAHAFARFFGGETRAARRLWLGMAAIFVPIAIALWYGQFWIAALGFVALALVQNFWRPITITRVDNETDAKMGATMFSIESQTKAAGTMVLAPIVGFGVDQLAKAPDSPALWFVGAIGLLIALVGALTPTMTPSAAEARSEAG